MAGAYAGCTSLDHAYFHKPIQLLLLHQSFLHATLVIHGFFEITQELEGRGRGDIVRQINYGSAQSNHRLDGCTVQS
jgi:hypothetical protein